MEALGDGLLPGGQGPQISRRQGSTSKVHEDMGRKYSVFHIVRDSYRMDVLELERKVKHQLGIITTLEVEAMEEEEEVEPAPKPMGTKRKAGGPSRPLTKEQRKAQKYAGLEPRNHGRPQALMYAKEPSSKLENAEEAEQDIERRDVLLHTLSVNCSMKDEGRTGIGEPWDAMRADKRKIHKAFLEFLQRRLGRDEELELLAKTRLRDGAIRFVGKDYAGILVDLMGLPESEKNMTHVLDAGLNFPGGKVWREQEKHWVHWLGPILRSNVEGGKAFSAKSKVSISWSDPSLLDSGKGKSTDLSANTTLNIKVVLEVYLDLKSINRRTPVELMEPTRYLLHALHPTPGYFVPHLPDEGMYRYTPAQTTVQDFFGNLKPAPLTSLTIMDKMQPRELQAELFPFQKRSLAFMMAREGATHIDSALSDPEAGDPTGFWEIIQLGDPHNGGVRMNFCRITGTLREITRDSRKSKGKGRAIDYEDEDDDAVMDLGTSAADQREWQVVTNGLFHLPSVRGSLLCEEMGLGKTMISIALILSNPASISAAEATPTWDPVQLLKFRKTKATLIVTPESLIQQWMKEVETFAPYLNVETYDGWKSLVDKPKPIRKLASTVRQRPSRIKRSVSTASTDEGGRPKDQHEESISMSDFISRISKADVVFCTYDTLARDWAHAQPPPARTTRDKAGVQGENRVRSGLLLFHWHRIFMDEVQLVPLSSNKTKPTEVLRGIKRTYAHAISGTPAKNDLDDLRGIMRFLGLDVSTHFWKTLQYPLFSEAFHSLFSRLAVRTTKAQLKGAGIPNQKRLLVALDLSAVEQRYNADLTERCFQALKITPDGFPTELKSFDGALLRKIIHELRQTATHIQVGALNVVGAIGGQRRLLTSHKKRNKILTMSEALVRMRLQGKRDMWNLAREEVLLSLRRSWLLGMQVRPAKAPKQTETILLRLFGEIGRSITELSALLHERDFSSTESDDSEESEDEYDPQVAFRGRIKDLKELSHTVSFALGNYYFNFGEEAKESEEKYYEEASRLRKELLKGPAQRADRSIAKVKKALGTSRVDDFSILEIEETKKLGLMSNRIGEDANETIEILGDNAELIWNWRGEIVKALTTPIEIEDGADATGEEYTGTMEGQHKLEAYMAAYGAAINDRIEIMSEQRTLLAVSNARPKKKRSTRTALEALQSATGIQVPLSLILDPVDEDIVQDVELLGKLMDQRQAVKERHSAHGRPLKAIIIDLNDVKNRTNRYEELVLAQDEVRRLKMVMKEQTEHIHKLTVELKTFQDSFNSRVEFFRSLQMLSDAVAEQELGNKSIPAQLEDITIEIQEKERAMALAAARSRFLDTVSDGNETSGDAKDEEEAENCVLCFSGFDDKAVLLACGHRFCLECFEMYRKTQGGRRCLLCRAVIEANDIQKVVMKRVEAAEPNGGISNARSLAQGTSPIPKMDGSVFSMMDAKHVAEVHDMEIVGEWGSKIDFLIKHISTRRDVKHIVFSSWNDALAIVKEALWQNRIGWVSIDSQKQGKNPVKEFAEGDDIHVFLLHGERESSGLTLTAASVVHMLEPVLNHGFEMQAIGRVDRLGQKSNTEVYCYAMRDTIEAKILHNHVNQGTCIYSKNNEGLINAAVTAVAKRGGDDLSGSTDELLDLIL